MAKDSEIPVLHITQTVGGLKGTRQGGSLIFRRNLVGTLAFLSVFDLAATALIVGYFIGPPAVKGQLLLLVLGVVLLVVCMVMVVVQLVGNTSAIVCDGESKTLTVTSSGRAGTVSLRDLQKVEWLTAHLTGVWTPPMGLGRQTNFSRPVVLRLVFPNRATRIAGTLLARTALADVGRELAEFVGVPFEETDIGEFRYEGKQYEGISDVLAQLQRILDEKGTG